MLPTISSRTSKAKFNSYLFMCSMSTLLHILFISSVFSGNFSFAQNQNEFIYHGFSGSNLSLYGLANIHPNGLLELTNITNREIGRAFIPLPFKLSNSSFSTNFVFVIDPERAGFGGHGFAFTICPSLDLTGAFPSQYLGIFNASNSGSSSNHIIAIEFDTINSVEFGDINDNHIGVDIDGMSSNVSVPAAYFADNQYKNITLISRDPIQAWIEYDEEQKIMNVTIAPITSPKPERPLLSTAIDLSKVLQDSMYIGFSASTGSMASHHYILGWSFNKGGSSRTLQLSKLPSLPPLPAPPPFSTPPTSSPRKSKSGISPLIIIVISVIAFGIVAIVFGVIYIARKKKYEESREDWEKEYGPQRFTYMDLYKATNGFNEKVVIGSGGFGKVYRGVFVDYTEVAVKKFSHNSEQGMKEFVAEIVSMGRLKHRNLVQLIGYCRRRGEMLLVYDYMPQGSLDKFLFHNETPNLNWVQRHQILKGVASALLYLHEEWEQVVLHRDVKASNVMLDADLNARLGDFGLAKFHDRGSISQTTCVVGTVGYLAPEVSRLGKFTTSSDVFAFGTLMLEVACGRKTIEPQRPAEEVILVDWVLESLKNGVILEICDPTLNRKYIAEEMELVLKLGLLCTHPAPTVRPNMRQVMQYLDGKVALPDIPMDTRAGLVIFNQEEAQRCLLSSPDSNQYYSLSITSSVLHCGR